MKPPQSTAVPAWPQRLPGLLLRPLALLPDALTQRGFVELCNRVFAAALAAGELDFLEGRILSVSVRDAGIGLRVSARGRRLTMPELRRSEDVRIDGDTLEFLHLVSRHEDPDTLFFQRRLRVTGDTELGLHVKNFLDAWEPPPAVQALQRLAAAALERLSP